MNIGLLNGPQIIPENYQSIGEEVEIQRLSIPSQLLDINLSTQKIEIWITSIEMNHSLPQIPVFVDQHQNYWLAGARELFEAYKRLARKAVMCSARHGSEGDAVRSFIASELHEGHRRKEKQRELLGILMKDEAYALFSNEEVSSLLSLPSSQVAEIRDSIADGKKTDI